MQTGRRKQKGGAAIFIPALVVVLFGLSLEGVRAVLDEAKSLALEAATPYVEKGFLIREDGWGGTMKPGDTRWVRHQLFRGNEYWFWLGTSYAGCELNLEIFDMDGMPVSLETFQSAMYAGARVLPSKTGTYLIFVEVKSQEAYGEVDWSLVYGFR